MEKKNILLRIKNIEKLYFRNEWTIYNIYQKINILNFKIVQRIKLIFHSAIRCIFYWKNVEFKTSD